MEKLVHLKNINQSLVEKLKLAGIDSPEKLREKGSRHVFVKIKTFDSGACYKMLLALEGAIQGVNIEDLNPKIKEELMDFMTIFNR